MREVFISYLGEVCRDMRTLIWHGIEEAIQLGLVYDFEGSVIQRIAKSFREFGGVPKPYFRIRKVFNPEIVRNEAECYIKAIKGE